MYKIWHLTEELPSRHDVVLQAWADERPGVLHISWAGNENLTMPYFITNYLILFWNYSILTYYKRFCLPQKPAWFPPGPDSSAALPSAKCAPSHPLLVLRQQQLAPAGDPSSQLPCYTTSSSLFSFLVIRSHFRRYLTRPACTQWPTCSWSQRRKAATPASIVALPGMRSLILFLIIFYYCCLWEYLLTRIDLRRHKRQMTKVYDIMFQVGELSVTLHLQVEPPLVVG